MGWRGCLRLIAAGLLLTIYVPLWAIMRPFGRQAAVGMSFLKMIGRLLGLRYNTEGAPPRGAVLIAANHISWLDILALGGSLPCRFIAKSEIAGWPLVGALARLADCVFVAREQRGSVRRQADAVVEALRGALPVVLFAEGQTGDGKVLTPFKPALFASAIEAGVPVQAVTIDYGPNRAHLAWPSGQSFGPEAKRLLNRRGIVPVTVRFLTPLDARILDRKALATMTHREVSTALT